MVPVSSRSRSASVDLPWSTWAMMEKFRILSGGYWLKSTTPSLQLCRDWEQKERSLPEASGSGSWYVAIRREIDERGRSFDLASLEARMRAAIGARDRARRGFCGVSREVRGGIGEERGLGFWKGFPCGEWDAVEFYQLELNLFYWCTRMHAYIHTYIRM